MAVEAVASFVREKLTEPIEKSLILKKVIDEVGEELRIIAGEEDRLKLESSRNERVKKCTCDYLPILYEVEDVIETFRVARDQRRRRSSLWPISGFFNGQSLRRKMEQIRRQIKKINGQKPDFQATAGSISSRSAQRLQQTGYHCSISSADVHDHDHEYLQEEKEPNGSTDLRRLGKNSSRRHELSFDELVQRPRHEHVECLEEEEEKQEANGSIDLPRIGKSSSSSSRHGHGHRHAPSLDELQLRHEHDECLDDKKESNSLGSVDLPRLGKTSSSNHRRASSQGSIKSDPSFNEFVRQLQLQRQRQPTPTFNLNWESLYNDLSFHSKLCLLYLTLFRKEYDIPVRRLLRLWLAEGFVKRSTSKIPEDVAQEYFEHLVKNNMIHISKFRSDGSPRKCLLEGHLYDKLSTKAQAISLFHIHDSNCVLHDPHPSSTSFVVRRIVEYVDIKNCDPPQLHSLRSYLSFNIQEKDTPAREVGQFLSRIIGNKQGSGFGLLRVLDLEGVYKPSLPENLGDLFNLRYLGLRWTFLDYLPSSVGDLPYLETLDVKHTNINNLPNSIWKLKQLRHLNLNEIRLDMPPHSFRLLTLWGLFVDNNSLVRNGLNRLHDLRELGVTFHLSSSGQEDIADWVENLTGLQSLRLRSRDERGCPLKLCLKPLSGLKNLSHLYLLGNLQKLPEQNEFPPAVKVLTLSVSRLEKDPMPILGQLPNLTVLRLLGDSYLGTEFSCPGFSKLQVLKLWMLKKLEKWDVEEGAMQNLKEVNIRCCHKLKNIPQTLLQSGTLKQLVLTNMPDQFKEDVRLKIKSSQTFLVVKNWKFTPLPWENDISSERALMI